MSTSILQIHHTDPIKHSVPPTKGRYELLRVIVNFLMAALGKTKRVTGFDFVANGTSGVVASGTLTLATCVAGTVIEVNGIEFVAIATGTPSTSQREFVISGTDTADAVSLTAAINAYAGFTGVLSASSSAAVVTVAASQKGAVGNAITIKMLGVRSSATITPATAVADNTVTINGVVLTAKVQRATGTLTAASAIAGDTFAIGGVTFTGAAGAATLGAATFSIDTSNNATATSIAAQINAYTGINALVLATAASAVVTVRAINAGTPANSIKFTGTATRLAASGTGTLAGGIAVANNQFDVSSGSTDTQVATDLARAINASTTTGISAHVVARADATVVTLRSKWGGAHRPTLTSSGTTLAVSGAGFFTAGTVASSDGAQSAGTITITTMGTGNTVTATINGTTCATVTYATSQANTAILLASSINQESALSGVVRAVSSSNTVIVTVNRGGLVGDTIPFTIATATGGGGAVTITADGSGYLGGTTAGAAPLTVIPSAERLTSGAGGNVASINVTL